MSIRMVAMVAVALLVSSPLLAQDAKTILDSSAKAMGDVRSVQFSGTGLNFALGQSLNPNAPWPKFNVTSYSRVFDYDAGASREEMVRVQGENPPRGGGGQPLAGEQRQVNLVSGDHAWNQPAQNPTPALAAATERAQQVWASPHGFIKAALKAGNATVKSQTVGGRKMNVVSVTAGGRHKLVGYLNDQNLVEKVEAWLDNPVLGDMAVEYSYTGYKDFAGVKFPAKFVVRQGGHAVLDLNVTDVKTNVSANIAVPDAIRNARPAPVSAQSEKVAEGVWYITGGSHHSALIEFKDHLVVIEGPQSEERSLAVLAEVKKLAPNKPIKYLVNTHHHFDHSGGIRTFAAEGATILTHQMHKPYYEKAATAPRTMSPDRLAQSKKKLMIETMTDKKVLTDGARTLELHHIKGNPHNDAIIMAYLPKEKILIEADVYTPVAANANPLQNPLNPFTVNLYENLERLKLSVDRILPIHGRLVTFGDLQKALGKTSN